MSNNIKVNLLAYTKEPLNIVYTAMRTCYSTETPQEVFSSCKNIPEQDKIDFVQKIVKMNHTSPLEHINFVFSISGIDRNCSHQLVRTRTGSYSQQSLRYTNIIKDCKKEQLECILKNNDTTNGINIASKYFTDVDSNNYAIYIKSMLNYIECVESGMKKEEARNLLCSNVRTQLVWSIDLKNLLNFLGHRCCTRAQKPIRILANKVVSAIKETGDFKFIEGMLAPKCVQIGYCNEGKMSCGLKPTLKELINRG